MSPGFHVLLLRMWGHVTVCTYVCGRSCRLLAWRGAKFESVVDYTVHLWDLREEAGQAKTGGREESWKWDTAEATEEPSTLGGTLHAFAHVGEGNPRGTR